MAVPAGSQVEGRTRSKGSKEEGKSGEVVPAAENRTLCKPDYSAVEYIGDGSRVVTIIKGPFHSPPYEQEMKEKMGDKFDPDGCYDCVEVESCGKRYEVPLVNLGVFNGVTHLM